MRSLVRLSLLAAVALTVVGASATNAAAATPSVRVAENYACALAQAGTVSCWGSNFRGQLGNGNKTDSSVPVPVLNVANAVQLDVGMYGACVLIADGTVKCWGANEYGALGTGAAYDAFVPTTVVGISGAIKIAVGEATVCALLSTPAGTVKCWGYGSSGELGIASPPSSTPTPQTITTLGGPATDIGAADFHACAVVGGALKCWGANYSKQIQNNATTEFDTPVVAGGVTSGAALAAPGNNHTCFITPAGAVKCWGANYAGQDGTGVSGGSSTTPQNNLITSGATFVGYGEDFHCALVGDVGKCWGTNVYGRLGDGTTDNRPAPTIPIGLGSGVTSIDAGGQNACAIVNKVVKCWGPNDAGALGNGTASNHNSPVDLPNISGATDVDVSASHGCAITSGSLKCWGYGGSGELGTGNTQNAPTAVAASAFSGSVLGVSTISGTTCVEFSAGLKCIGNGTDGELGNNSTSNAPTTPVNTSPALAGVGRVDGRGDTYCAVDGGQVYCWGTNSDSRLGQGAGQTAAVLDHLDNPTLVPGIASGATSVAVGYRHVCAVVSNSLRCWGRNSNGEVTGTTTVGENPAVQTPGVNSVSSGSRAVAASYGTTCAVVTSPSGGVKCFGSNTSGQLGNNSQVSQESEVSVTGITGATQLAAADSTFCALITGGTIKCWGWNAEGELGDGTNARSGLPVSALGITNAIAISGQGSTLCAALSTGGVKCWGDGTRNQLGVGSALYSASPGDVLGLSLFPPDLPPPYVKQKVKPTFKISGKIKKSGKTQIKVPLKLYYAAPAGSNAATVCGGTGSIKIKITKKKTTKLKVKFKRKAANCSYSTTVKLPKSFKGKNTKFSISLPGNADVFSYKSTKTLKLK
jgi:alpha-tubulin suppressor-like RCC1 family protein